MRSLKLHEHWEFLDSQLIPMNSKKNLTVGYFEMASQPS